MNAYEVLRDVHHVGSRISGTVLFRDKPEVRHGFPCGHLTIDTGTAYPAWLSYDRLVDQPSAFSPEIIPEVGTRIDAVVFNFAADTLHLSARPSDLNEATVLRYQQYYDYIATLTEGSTIAGVVKQAVPFGLFVDIGGPFVGLVDIGFNRFPRNRSDWPAVGEDIECLIHGFRFRNQQIALGWSPIDGA